MRTHLSLELPAPVLEGFHMPRKAGHPALDGMPPAVGQNVKLMVKLDGMYPCANEPAEQTDWFAMGGDVIEVLGPTRVRTQLYPSSDNVPAIMEGAWQGILEHHAEMEYEWLLVALTRTKASAENAAERDNTRWGGLGLMGLGLLVMASDAWSAYEAIAGRVRPPVLRLSFKTMALGVMISMVGVLAIALGRRFVQLLDGPRYMRTWMVAFGLFVAACAITGDSLLTHALERSGYTAPRGTDTTWQLSRPPQP